MKREVLIIPADNGIRKPINENIRKCRTAAYCRVSTDVSEQLASYHSQIAYYVNLISQNEKWEYVDIYADEGISGTKANNRNEFNRLLEDCRHGLIDLVIVKSISRFSRNTVDCLKYVRELRTLKVDVFFESQNIHSISPASDFIITMHAMHAQEQVISLSNNLKWTIRNRMRTGTWMPAFVGFGYKAEADEIVKDDETVPVVELIKNLYLDGYSLQRIQDELEKRKIPSPKGNQRWSAGAIQNILYNPLYQGHLIAQKTYTGEAFPFERRRNNGELPRYMYEHDHEPYISEEEAERIEQITMIRKMRNSFSVQVSESMNRNKLSGKIICHSCGETMKRIIKTSPKGIGYSCPQHIRDKTKCGNRTVMEDTIYRLFNAMINKLKCHEDLLDDYLKDLKVLNTYVADSTEADSLKEKYEYTKKQIYEVAQDYTRGLCESAFYMQKVKELRTTADQLYRRIGNMRSVTGYKKEIEETENLKRILNSIEYAEEFSEELFERIVDHAEADNQKMMIFHLRNGLTLKEEADFLYA